MTAGLTKTRVIDGDGHINEDLPAIRSRMPSPYREIFERQPLSVYPPIDHLHSARAVETPANREDRPFVGVEGWASFLDDVGIERTVLYPTYGLSFGHIESLDYAVVLARAYNEWLSETYVKADPRFHGMALLPMQDPEQAAKELNRAVTELGLLGGVMMSNGHPTPVGNKPCWPVFAEADALGCCLAVHGGSHDAFGMDHMNWYTPVHALGHPHGQMVSCGSMIFNGVFDMFPNIRVAFLEGGVAWLLLILERFAASHETHFQYIPPGTYGIREGQDPGKYIIDLIKEGRFFIGCETEELTMPFALKVVGSDPFIYSSDFPHEVTNASCKHDIAELMESDDMTLGDKEGILFRNSERFYRF